VFYVIDNIEYLVPCDATTDANTFIAIGEEIKNKLDEGRPSSDKTLILLILDCCRTSLPIGDRIPAPDLGEDDGSLSNLFIAYSTTKGRQASDSGGFGKSLTKYIDEDLQVEDVFKKVGQDLEKELKSQVSSQPQ